VSDLSALLLAFQWREPLWLLLLPLPFLVTLLRSQIRHRQLDAYAEPSLQPWAFSQQSRGIYLYTRLRHVAFLLAWLLLVTSLAGPRMAPEDSGKADRLRSDIVLIVDVSRSMLAADPPPGRLRRAQIELDEFLTHAPGHRIAIVLFAARAHLYVPLTSDYDALSFYIDSLDRLRLPTAGSQPQEAVAMAAELLKDTEYGGSIIMLTDGSWEQPNVVESSFPLFILGVGTDAGGAIPLGDGRWLEKEGADVISRLNRDTLAAIAKRSGGAYSRFEKDDGDWQKLYDQGLKPLLPFNPEPTGTGQINWNELYHWTLVPGFLLLLLALAPSLNRLRVEQLATFTVPVLAIFLLLEPGEVRADREQAYAAYLDERYPEALELFRHVEGYEGRLGEAAVHYRLESYDQAARGFIQAVNLAENDTERGKALFNLGNSYFQAGDFAQATAVFEDALLFRPDHEASRYNLRLSRSVQKAVEELLANMDEAAERRPAGIAGEGEVELDPENLLRSDDGVAALSGERQLPDLPEQILAHLLVKGIARARLADETPGQRAGRLQKEISLTDARLRMEALREHQERLWIRLFEMEEGFPGALVEPLALPGVDPW
jgi:Ca-activated chloride channel family protein